MLYITDSTTLQKASLVERNDIVIKCHNDDMNECYTEEVRKQGGYKKGSKHDPTGDIPTIIWANITEGTKKEMYEEYKRNSYKDISEKEFGGYVRELVKQGILIKS